MWMEHEEFLVSENDPCQGQINTACKKVSMMTKGVFILQIRILLLQESCRLSAKI